MKKPIKLNKKSNNIKMNLISFKIFKNYQFFNNRKKSHITIDRAVIDKIISSGWDLKYEYIHGREYTKTMTALKHLKLLRNNMSGNLLTCEFDYKDKSYIGRAYYKNLVSTTWVDRRVRALIMTDINKNQKLFDYDIHNCHYNILLNLVNASQRKSIPNIQYYCDYRNSFLKQIVEENSNIKTKEDAKDLMLRVLNQGSLYKYQNNTNSFKRIKAIREEVRNLFTDAIKKNEEFFKQCQIDKKAEVEGGDDEAPFRSFIGKFFQHKERQILEHIIKRLEEDKIIDKNRYDYAFDGLLIEKQIDPNILIQYSKEIGFDLIWTEKKPEDVSQLWEDIELSINNNKIQHPEHTLENFNIQYFTSLAGKYDLLKDYFEKFYTFVVNPEPVYWYCRVKKWIDSEGHEHKNTFISPVSIEDMKKSYEHIHSSIKETRYGDKKILFIDEYKRDINKICKNEICFHPQNSNRAGIINDEDNFNTFVGYNDICFEAGLKSKTGILHNYLLCLKNLVGGEEEMKICLNLFAQKIKYPARKQQYSVAIHGPQGTGKNVCTSVLADIVGNEHFYCTANIQDICGTHAEGMANKLIVVMNEVNFNETKGLTDRIKSLITEDKITVNPKHIRMYETRNYALMLFLTNRPCFMEIDIDSHERRFFIFRSNNVNTTLSYKQWGYLRKQWKTKEFIQQLYLYLMNLQVDKFDFKQKQRQMTKSPAYQKLASYFIPPVAIFFEYYITNRLYVDEIIKYDTKYSTYDDSSKPVEVKPQKNKYYDYDDFDKSVSVKFKDLRTEYTTWYKAFGGDERFKKTQKNFDNAINNYKSLSSKVGTGNIKMTTFTPSIVLADLIKRNFSSIDNKEWKNKLPNEKTAKDCGFIFPEGES
jgi:hypothetical protein